MPDMPTAEKIKPGLFDLSDWGGVFIEGPDAADYLNRMSTADIKKLGVNGVSHAAFLTGRGLVVALGMLERATSERFFFWHSHGQTEKLLAHLEMFHFAEKITFSDMSSSTALLGFWRQEPFPGVCEMKVSSGEWNDVSMSAWREDARHQFIWGKMDRLVYEEIRSQVPWLPLSDYEYLRLEAGIPEVGKEAGESDIILETGFDRSVARNKGCYPGQEVVERIFTYGSVNRKLLRVSWEGELPPLPAEFEVDGKTAGRWVSVAVEPGQKDRGVGLAYVQKNFWEYAKGVKVGGATLHWKNL